MEHSGQRNLAGHAPGRVAGLAIDALLVLLLGLWLCGGVTWHGHLWLRHGADSRRAALLVGAAAAWGLPGARERSLLLRGARRLWDALETRAGRRIALAAGWAYATALCCLQAMALRTPMYDVGIFHQILWALAHGHGFLSTISGAGNFLLDHTAFSLILLVPAYWVAGGSPLLLPIIQPALIYAGAAAWVWLAARLDGGTARGSRSRLAAAATVFALSFDSLWGALHWGFHENAIAFAALSWALALVLACPGRRLGPLALFLIAAASKEILAVDVALGLVAWAWLERRRSRGFAFVLVFISVALLGGFACFEHLPHPADKNYFDRYYSYLGHGLGEFARTLLLSPWVVVRAVGAGALARYLLTVLGPWLFLPLVALSCARRESAWLLLVLPSLASAALSTDASLRGADFHYVLELWPALAALTLVVLPRLRGARFWALAWAGLALLAWDHDPWGDLRSYVNGASDAAPVRTRMSEVPPDASVSADELSGTWLAGRERVTRWSQLAPFGGHCPEWLVLRAPELDDARRICGASLAPTHVAGDWVFVRTGVL